MSCSLIHTNILVSCALMLISTVQLNAQRVDSIAVLNNEGHFVDQRDGQEYNIIRIDELWWMNQNLNYTTENSYCFDDDEVNCLKFGRLYAFSELDKVCPENWRIPTTEEFDTLLEHVPGERDYGTIHTKVDWDVINSLTHGIYFQPSGMKVKRKYKVLNSFNIWLEDEISGYHVHMFELIEELGLSIYRHNHEEYNPIIKKRKFAVRCVTPS